ncbi:glutamate--tRNA ligase [Tessaracoccus sp. MC1679]|uniref:glutamate--tRNA ligase n=1 Tax=Tessaracoccus sp. MC1679 TaxID=2760313 RepID=UPI001600A814|nr:glutamate--tRNA ligase [Tessaracoccus sp. MC1679]MBB1516671.1 glutamate--tRNA ligase [Tessaracoccus sp. MC1679]
MSATPTPARTRVAPSPTGDPHVGTAFMALFDLAWARKTGGAFVLRIEDTDQARLVEGSEQQIYDSLEWLGLQADEGPHLGGDFGPYRQSERLDTYRPFVEQLLADGHAYHCWCSSERLAGLRKEQEALKLSVTGYDRLCLGKTREERAALPGFSETPVVRMLIPDDAPLEFEDIVRGTVKAPRPDDQVILKADGFPTYHLAVVVDDHLMGIDTVVRGEEWISSTPKHVLLYDWLGWKRPAFAHMPLLRNTDKSKISKRKNPAARLMWFKEQGYLPEAVRNFLQLLGYAGDEESEVSTFEQFVEGFSWSKVNTVGPIFDLKKLDWLNGHYIRSLSAGELASRILEFEADWAPTGAEAALLRSAVPLIQERLVLLKDARPQLDYLFAVDEALVIDDDALAGLAENAAEVLDAAIAVAESVPFSTDAIQAGLRERIVEGMGIKPKFAFAPIRVAISGRKVSPPLFESMELLGRESSLARLRALRASL